MHPIMASGWLLACRVPGNSVSDGIALCGGRDSNPQAPKGSGV